MGAFDPIRADDEALSTTVGDGLKWFARHPSPAPPLTPEEMLELRLLAPARGCTRETRTVVQPAGYPNESASTVSLATYAG